MRAVVQRVKGASVTIDGTEISRIGKGLMVLLGITETDTEADIEYICDKVINLRIFEDEDEKMNLSLSDVNGEIMLVSQFTLYGDARKGRRPSFIQAAKPEISLPLYEKTIECFKQKGINVACGEFGADMLVEIKNDGPCTILLESDRLF